MSELKTLELTEEERRQVVDLIEDIEVDQTITAQKILRLKQLVGVVSTPPPARKGKKANPVDVLGVGAANGMIKRFQKQLKRRTHA